MKYNSDGRSARTRPGRRTVFALIGGVLRVFLSEAAGAKRRRRPDESGEAALRGAHGRPKAPELLQIVDIQVSYKVFMRA